MQTLVSTYDPTRPLMQFHDKRKLITDFQSQVVKYHHFGFINNQLSFSKKPHIVTYMLRGTVQHNRKSFKLILSRVQWSSLLTAQGVWSYSESSARPVHTFTLPGQLFVHRQPLCPPTVPWRTVSGRESRWLTWQNQASLQSEVACSMPARHFHWSWDHSCSYPGSSVMEELFINVSKMKVCWVWMAKLRHCTVIVR